jgi:hypothetical protein
MAAIDTKRPPHQASSSMYTVTGCQHCSTVCHDPFPPAVTPWRIGLGRRPRLGWCAVHVHASLSSTTLVHMRTRYLFPMTFRSTDDQDAWLELHMRELELPRKALSRREYQVICSRKCWWWEKTTWKGIVCFHTDERIHKPIIVVPLAILSKLACELICASWCCTRKLSFDLSDGVTYRYERAFWVLEGHAGKLDAQPNLSVFQCIIGPGGWLRRRWRSALPPRRARHNLRGFGPWSISVPSPIA